MPVRGTIVWLCVGIWLRPPLYGWSELALPVSPAGLVALFPVQDPSARPPLSLSIPLGTTAVILPKGSYSPWSGASQTLPWLGRLGQDALLGASKPILWLDLCWWQRLCVPVVSAQGASQHRGHTWGPGELGWGWGG